MAKSKTPAKRARRAEDNRLKNKAFKSQIKTATRKYTNALKDENQETAKKELLQVSSLIDKSVSKGIMHKNTAARRKSALAKKYNQISAQ